MKSIIFLLFFLCLIPISSCETIVFNNDLCLNEIDKIIVFQNNEFVGIYNYSENIYYNDTSDYTFVINNDVSDIINSESFLITLFKNYGYVIISILGLTLIYCILVYYYKKVKK